MYKYSTASVFLFGVMILNLVLPSTSLDDKDPILNYASLDKPFRMQKCNIAWDKARTKPLQESKLKLLYYELKLQDKEELALKKLKSEMGDKDGLREAQVRKKFNGIMNTYGLVRESSSISGEKTVVSFFLKFFASSSSFMVFCTEVSLCPAVSRQEAISSI